jgi:Zn-dependent alcohol dehydrogenase
MVREGELDLQALVTRRYPFDQINDAVSALEHGEVLGRCIVTFA